MIRPASLFTFALALTTLCLAACPTADGAAAPDVVEPEASQPDAAQPDTSEPDTAEPDDGAFTASLEAGFVGTADDGSLLWLVEAMDDDKVLRIEVYESFGAPTSAATVDLTDVEADYASCATCVVLDTGCSDPTDVYSCAHTWMPHPEGSVRFDEMGTDVGEAFAGELLHVRFREVTIGSDFSTTPVDNDASIEWTSWAFNVDLEGFPGADVCGGHGHTHDGVCHCDDGYVTDPGDPANCVAE